jgi:hypothetical protein
MDRTVPARNRPPAQWPARGRLWPSVAVLGPVWGLARGRFPSQDNPGRMGPAAEAAAPWARRGEPRRGGAGPGGAGPGGAGRSREAASTGPAGSWRARNGGAALAGGGTGGERNRPGTETAGSETGGGRRSGGAGDESGVKPQSGLAGPWAAVGGRWRIDRRTGWRPRRKGGEDLEAGAGPAEGTRPAAANSAGPSPASPDPAADKRAAPSCPRPPSRLDPAGGETAAGRRGPAFPTEGDVGRGWGKGGAGRPGGRFRRSYSWRSGASRRPST